MKKSLVVALLLIGTNALHINQLQKEGEQEKETIEVEVDMEVEQGTEE